MSDYSELRDAVRRVITGGPLLPLREWVEDYEVPVSASPNPAFRELISDVWAILSESDLGELDQEAIIARLIEALKQSEAQLQSVSELQGVEARSSAATPQNHANNTRSIFM